jgi:c-di-GMP-related signal transduction protein
MSRPFMVGRQPIFDDKLDVFGYELLFRNGPKSDQDGDTMTADVLVHAGLDLGLERLVGTKLAFVNATRSFLLGDQDIPLSPEQTVIEVLETVVHDPPVLDGCRRLAQKGYKLALDDYVWTEEGDPLLELVDIVKLDLLAIPVDGLAEQVDRCSAFGAMLVAEKVETRQQLEVCRQMGFDLFQGYLLSRPETVQGRALTSTRLTCLQLLQRLCNPDISVGEMQRIVETDAGLSHQLLRAAGVGAADGMRRSVGSIREAVVVLGLRQLRSWVTLMLVAGAHGGSEEQLAIAMTRARMSELMAARLAPRRPDAGFTVGLVSALDMLLASPLPEVIDHLALTDELVDALLRHAGPLGEILSDVLAWELGCPNMPLRSGLRPKVVEKIYIEALAWATEICRTLERAG